MRSRIKCPLCGMVVDPERFARDYPLELVNQTFASKGRGRGVITTIRQAIRPWPGLVHKLQSLLERFSVEIVRVSYRYPVRSAVKYAVSPSVVTAVRPAVSFNLGGE